MLSNVDLCVCRRDAIVQVLESNPHPVRYWHEVAASSRLLSIFAQACTRAVHVSCHGHSNYLVFEHDEFQLRTGAKRLLCSAAPLTEGPVQGAVAGFASFQELFENAEPSGIKLLVLTACSSLNIGQFCSNRQLLGAKAIPHVICVTGAIRDDFCVAFSQRLYELLFSGATVQAAFSAACLEVHASERDFLSLLPAEDSHAEAVFADVAALSGPCEDLTPALPFNNLLKKVPPLLPCRLCLLDLVYCQFRNSTQSQCFALTGFSGIGKTHFASHLARRYLVRATLPSPVLGGMFMLRMQGKHALHTAVDNKFATFLGLEGSLQSDAHLVTALQERLTTLPNKTFVLILDGIDEWLNVRTCCISFL